MIIAGAGPARSLGGKANGLVRLAGVSIVPHFIVLDAAWIEARLDRLVSEVPELIAGNGLTGPLAVRSSAEGEDGDVDSFAGLYETVLGVSTVDAGQAVRQVWSSADSDRVRAYKEARKLPEAISRMSVIVQEMVDARVSGVAFSRDPGDAGVVLIEAVRGVGEELVSGQARPDVYRVDAVAGVVVDERRGRQFAETRADGTRRRLVGREISDPRLSGAEAVGLARAVIAIAQDFRDAENGVDVEWAIDSEGLKFLQCRPITTRSADPETRRADARDIA